MKKVYFAGKMGEWLTNKIPGACWRPFSAVPSDDDFDPETPNYPQPEVRQLFQYPFLYVGPWKGRGSYHCYIHGITSCNSEVGTAVWHRATAGIRDCDIFFAMLDDETAFGTLVEIGYAAALHKRIIVGQTQKYEWPYEDNLWFAKEAAEQVIVSPTCNEVLYLFADKHLRR